MNALAMALAGGYVNFGVFALYGDKALDNALETVLKLAFNVSDVPSGCECNASITYVFAICLRNASARPPVLNTFAQQQPFVADASDNGDV